LVNDDSGTAGTAGRTHVVLFGQRLNQQLAKCAAGTIQPRADSTDRNPKRFCNRRIVHLFKHVEDQDGALIGGNPGKRLLQDPPEVLAFQVVGWIIAITLLNALELRLGLVLATARLAPCQMETAVDDRAGQPRSQVCGHLIFTPQANERLLDCVPGRIFVSEDATRDRDEVPEQGASRFGEIHLLGQSFRK
jgi:hypothetical protein